MTDEHVKHTTSQSFKVIDSFNIRNANQQESTKIKSATDAWLASMDKVIAAAEEYHASRAAVYETIREIVHRVSEDDAKTRATGYKDSSHMGLFRPEDIDIQKCEDTIKAKLVEIEKIKYHETFACFDVH
jgi:hypothetical protein